MRLALVLAFGLALAGPASSQQSHTPAPKATPSGPQTPPQEPGAPPAAPMTPLAGPAQTPAQLADQCRASCAQAYYFCLASDSPDSCPQSWGQCRTSCNAVTNRR